MLFLSKGTFNVNYIDTDVCVNKPKQDIMKKVNQYLLIKKIGYGASSKIYYVYDSDKDKYFAAKVFRSRDYMFLVGGTNQLYREVSILKNSNHPNILKLEKSLCSSKDKLALIIMEYMNVGSLKSLIDRGVELSEEKIACIFKQVVDGLIYLHNNNIAHRDIKPGNILLNTDGKVVISDFGIGRSFQSADCVVGSPGYQAPEMFGNDDEVFDDSSDVSSLDPVKQDVWSLGVSLFETCFGYLPFAGSNVYEIAREASLKPLEIPESASKELKELLLGVIHIDPESRFDLERVRNSEFLKKACSPHELNLEAVKIGEYDLYGDYEQINAVKYSPSKVIAPVNTLQGPKLPSVLAVPSLVSA